MAFPQDARLEVERPVGVARTGFEVGARQSGASLELPAQVQAIAHSVFTHAFVDAMHPTLVLPIVVFVLAARATLVVRGRGQAEIASFNRQLEAEAAVA